jgi:hypothetical protein
MRQFVAFRLPRAFLVTAEVPRPAQHLSHEAFATGVQVDYDAGLAGKGH